MLEIVFESASALNVVESDNSAVLCTSGWTSMSTAADASGGSYLVNPAMDSTLTMIFTGMYLEIGSVSALLWDIQCRD